MNKMKKNRKLQNGHLDQASGGVNWKALFGKAKDGVMAFAGSDAGQKLIGKGKEFGAKAAKSGFEKIKMRFAGAPAAEEV